MKTKIIFKAIMLSAINLLCLNLYAQPQMKTWYTTPNIINVTNPTPTVTSIPGTTPPPPTANFVTNSMCDASGSIIFYIADDKVYGPSNNYIGSIGFITEESHALEIAIAPFNCEGRKYHVFFYNSYAPEDAKLFYNTIDMTGSGSVGTMTEIDFFNNADVGGIAVGNLTTSGKRYVYAVCGGPVASITDRRVDKFTINSDNTLSGPTTIVNGNTSNMSSFDFSTVEADLSHDGTKLAWASRGNTVNKAYILNLNSTTGDYAGTFNQYTYGQTGLWGRGVEFNADGTKLYAGGVDGIYQITGTGASLTTRITNTNNYGHSQLEMGYSGRIYAVSYTANLIIGIDPSNNSLTSTATYTPKPGSNYTQTLVLPDQIDGYDYATQLQAFNETSYTTPVGNPTWTSGSGGNIWNASIVRIKSSLTVPSGSTLTIRNMTVEFGLGATLNVLPGGKLKLEKATLQAACPLNMWQGIVVTGTGEVTMTNYGLLTYSTIYDAIIGIDLSGTSAKATVNSLALFERNETHIKINNGGSQNTFITSYFKHQVPLKDQSKGKDQNNGTTGTRYGDKSFHILNCSNPQTIGGTPNGYGNWFYDGQYGIYAENSNVNINRNIFHTLRTRGVFADGQWASGGRNINVTTLNTFTSCRTNIDGHYGINLTVKGNTFNSGSEHGITWVYNPARELIIGSETNLGDANTFTGQNWSSVMASDNAHANTRISIGYNTIQNASWAGGIYVQESSGQTGQTYQKMHILHNTINDIGDGVVVNNVWGINNIIHWQAQEIGEPDPGFKINNSDIDFSTAYGQSKSGIRVSNSRFVRSRYNNVATTSNFNNWGNKGIDYANSRYSLIEKNYCKANAGIQLTGDMLESNIDCNDLGYCIIGIEMNNEILRSAQATHGDVNDLNRVNYFTNTASWGFDMRLFNTNPLFNKWVEPNTTSINYNPISGNIIVNGGTSQCDRLQDYEMLMGGGDENGSEQETQYQQTENDSYWFEEIADENQKWTVAYNEQAEQNASEDGLIITDNSFIPAVLNLEKILTQGDFETGREVWQQLNPVHSFENNLKDVYGVFLAYRPEEPRLLSEDEKTTLIKVAQQNSWEAGPAVYSARAILKYKENLEFYDVTEAPAMPYESGKTDETSVTHDPRFAAYPIPAKNYLTLLSGVEGFTYYKIVSLEGRTIQQGSFSIRTDVNAENLSAGAYYLEMADQNGTIHYRKLITKN